MEVGIFIDKAFDFDWKMNTSELGSEHPYWANYIKLDAAHSYLHKLGQWNQAKQNPYLKKYYFGKAATATDIEKELSFWFSHAVGGYNHINYRCYQPSGALI